MKTVANVQTSTSPDPTNLPLPLSPVWRFRFLDCWTCKIIGRPVNSATLLDVGKAVGFKVVVGIVDVMIVLVKYPVIELNEDDPDSFCASVNVDFNVEDPGPTADVPADSGRSEV